MTWLNPPIEEVVEMAGSKYILCSVVSKRAKELLLDNAEFFKTNQKIKPIEYASKEFYEGVYTVSRKSREE